VAIRHDVAPRVGVLHGVQSGLSTAHLRMVCVMRSVVDRVLDDLYESEVVLQTLCILDGHSTETRHDVVGDVVWHSVSRHIWNGRLYGSVLEGDRGFMSAVDTDIRLSAHFIDQSAAYRMGGIPDSSHCGGAETETDQIENGGRATI